MGEGKSKLEGSEREKGWKRLPKWVMLQICHGCTKPPVTMGAREGGTGREGVREGGEELSVVYMPELLEVWQTPTIVYRSLDDGSAPLLLPTTGLIILCFFQYLLPYYFQVDLRDRLDQ